MEIREVVAWPVARLPVLVLLGEAGALTVLLAFIVLLTIFDETALALSRGPFAFALDDAFHRLGRRGFVKLLDEPRMRARPVLSLGVQ